MLVPTRKVPEFTETSAGRRTSGGMDHMKNSKNVLNYLYGKGAVGGVGDLVDAKRAGSGSYAVWFVDEYFKNRDLPRNLPLKPHDQVIFVPTSHEPTTNDMDAYVASICSKEKENPCAVVGIGGGITLDTAKAVSNLLTNGGKAEDYQGWDLVKLPGVYKIGVPTLSGTGAESSRTCVMMNVRKNLKLGMNSEYTVYDQVVLDPDLTRTVNRNQYFYTGMDTYIHCVESLRGSYRHAVGDAFSREALALCDSVFKSEDMMADEQRERLMVASYFGGAAIANSFVGVVHPFSAGLSVVLKTHHCVANCIVMNVLDEFYPDEAPIFREMVERQKVEIPRGLCRNLTDEQYEKLYLSTVIHEKPLTNALGPSFRDILTREKVIETFKKM
jgi:3-deoxy-alpha-D-manno-octulosonate 8-oxidase